MHLQREHRRTLPTTQALGTYPKLPGARRRSDRPTVEQSRPLGITITSPWMLQRSRSANWRACQQAKTVEDVEALLPWKLHQHDLGTALRSESPVNHGSRTVETTR